MTRREDETFFDCRLEAWPQCGIEGLWMRAGRKVLERRTYDVARVPVERGALEAKPV
jgi:hypothetical protein